MNESDFGDWLPMKQAPRDGTRILVAIRPTEQGPAEVDVVRWTKPQAAAEPCWVAIDSDPAALVTYSEVELTWWMPMPDPLRRGGTGRPVPPTPPPEPEEIGGSGI